MPHKDLNNLDIYGKISFILLGLVAGIIHFFKRNLTNVSFWKTVLIFFYDVITFGSIAIFTGLIVYSTYDNLALALGIGGFAGHLGTKILYLVEKYVQQRFNIKE